MTEEGRKVNGVANIVMLLALVAATIVSIAAIIQQPWPWWEGALAICGILFGWGFVLAIVAQAIKPVDKGANIGPNQPSS